MIRFLINNDIVELNEARAFYNLYANTEKRQGQRKDVRQATVVHVPWYLLNPQRQTKRHYITER